MSSDRIGYAEGVSLRNNCFSFIDKHLEEHPDKVCMQWVNTQNKMKFAANPEGEQLIHDPFTYQNLYDMVVHTAAGYKKLGIKEGDRVIIFVPMIPWLYSSMFAFQMIGAIPVFLDTFVRHDKLAYVAKLVDAKAWVSVEQAFVMADENPILANIPIKISMGPVTREYTARYEELLQTPEVAEPVPVSQDHTALITFTTGSTGAPKGADRSHRFLAAQHYGINGCLPYADDDNDLPVFPVFSLNNIAAGVTTILPAINVAQPAETDAYLLFRQIKEAKVNCMTLNPSLLNGLNKFCLAKGLTLPELKRVAAGGAAVSLDVVKEFAQIAPNCELVVMYGSTEAEPMTHITGKEMMEQVSVSEKDPELVDSGVNVGHFADGLTWKFIKNIDGPIKVSSDEEWTALEVPKGEVGELVVAGEHVCRSYYNNPEAFKKVKVQDHNDIIWHRTGDLARMGDDGNVWIVGRTHNVIERKGQYLFPVKAEVVMKRQPYAKLAAYLGVKDAELGEKTVCVIAPHDKGLLTDTAKQEEYTKDLIRIMSKNDIPVDKVIFRENVPMDARHQSKVEYGTLRDVLKEEGLV